MDIYKIIYIAALLIGMLTFFMAIKHAYLMWQEITPSAQKQANWLPFITPFLAGSYSPKGQSHLAMFGKYSLITFICLLALAFLKQ